MIKASAVVGVVYSGSDTLPHELCKQHLLHATIENRDVSIFPRLAVVVKSPLLQNGEPAPHSRRRTLGSEAEEKATCNTDSITKPLTICPVPYRALAKQAIFDQNKRFLPRGVKSVIIWSTSGHSGLKL